MICLSRLAIELCLSLNITWEWQQIKGVSGNLQGLSSRAQPGLLGDSLPSGFHSLEGPAFPRTWRLTIRLTSHLFLTQDVTPGHLKPSEPLPTIVQVGSSKELCSGLLHGEVRRND